MPWEVSKVAGWPVVETRYYGMMRSNDLADAVGDTMRLADAEGIDHLLADLTAIEGGHSIVDLFLLADDVLPPTRMRRIREAVVVPEDSPMLAKALFWETTGINHGVQVRVFHGRAVALAWLADAAS